MRRIGLSTVLALSTLLFISVSSAQQTSTTSVPNLIRYNGTLKDMQGTASIPFTAVGVTFAIYKQQDGGAPLWQETQNVTPDANGQYNVMLGSTKSEGVPADLFSDQDQRWLGVKVEGQPEQARVLMVSVPYAFRAHEAETLGGLPASAFVQANPANVPGTAANAPTNAAATLSQASGATAPAFPPITGSGKKNYIPIWTSGTNLENSALFQIGGNVGLGTTTPGAKLEVVASPASNSSVGAIRGTGATRGLTGIATALSGYSSAVHGQNASVNGTGVSGQTVGWVGVGGMATATSGSPAYGVWGDSLSTGGVGVAGFADATSGYTSGVSGSDASPNGTGISGFNNATIGGTGVSGVATATSGSATGVAGTIASTSGAGVAGNATATSGFTNGVYGRVASSNGVGVAGFNNATTGGTGVSGVATATSGSATGVAGTIASTSGAGVGGNATATSGFTNGVYGSVASPNGVGVAGVNNASTGGSAVSGVANATSGSPTGVYGSIKSTSGAGVAGIATATSGFNSGVYGQTASSSGFGVNGTAVATSGPAIGVHGQSNSSGGTAGQFVTAPGGTVLQGVGGSTTVFAVDSSGNGFYAGDLNVTGKLTKGSGSFKIDHPLDPANKYLSHSFVESPDMMDVYNGNVTTDKRGRAIVALPDYFQSLNRDFRYQLTVIGQFAQAIVAREISGNHFTIKTNKPGVKVSWQVTGIRQDAYANAHRISVEEPKPVQERGKYLHPDVFGVGVDKNMSAQLH